MSGPESRRFIFPRGGLKAHFWVQLPPAGKFGQEQGDGVTVPIFSCLLVPVSVFLYSQSVKIWVISSVH